VKQDSETRTFLNRFFGDGNKFHLAAIESGQGKAGRILPWLMRIINQQENSTVLPEIQNTKRRKTNTQRSCNSYLADNNQVQNCAKQFEGENN
jgi:hypothetical protein